MGKYAPTDTLAVAFVLNSLRGGVATLTEGASRMCANPDGCRGFAGRPIMQEIHIVKGWDR